MNIRLARRSVATTIASAVVAVAASCVTLGSVVLLFGSPAEHSTAAEVAARVEPARS